MPLAAKALFTVTAGIIPGQVMPEHTRRWTYTSADYEQDAALPAGELSIFELRIQEAHDYAIQLSNPRHLNWVRVDWMWI